jgi:hypothetical protein
MNLDITGSAEVFLQESSGSVETTSTFVFLGTAIGTLTFDWDLTDVASIGVTTLISVRVSVTNPGDQVIVTQPIGFECDVALFNATDDGNPVFA